MLIPQELANSLHLQKSLNLETCDLPNNYYEVRLLFCNKESDASWSLCCSSVQLYSKLHAKFMLTRGLFLLFYIGNRLR